MEGVETKGWNFFLSVPPAPKTIPVMEGVETRTVASEAIPLHCSEDYPRYGGG